MSRGFNICRLLVIALIIMLSACNKINNSGSSRDTESNPVFNLLLPSSTGIMFVNKLRHNVATKANLFDFDYFYNGAGVGIGDINNDGLQDIFFCGNQVDNKLFLNKGNMVFEDISQSAKININKNWSNGVVFADVNEDGWMDIYVSQGGPHQPEQRKNILLINQGDLTFKEEASEYGLADTGFSTQSAFFDFDRDGDLDCIVMNENPLYGVDPISFYKAFRKQKDLLYKSSSHFFINEGGKFIDATAQVGLLRPSFGLGLVISDINEDGWLDIYMANDYFIPDAMFINQKNGTFFDEIKLRSTQVSFYGMGADIADINNDLSNDIFVLDMASADHYRAKTLMASMNITNFNLLVNDFDYAYQYMFNSLQLNHTNNNFSNVAHQLGIAKTDWSWAGLLADFNNDGWKDIYVTNGYRRYAKDNDFQNKVRATQQKYNGNVPIEVKSNLYNQMPSEKLPNLLFQNRADLKFTEESSNWGLSYPSFSNGAAYADLDQDGDLDLVVNNLDEQAFVFENTTRDNELGNFLTVDAKDGKNNSFARVFITCAGEKQTVEMKGVRGYFSYSEPRAHFGIGNHEIIDTVRVEWLDGSINEQHQVEANQAIYFNKGEDTSVAKKNDQETQQLFKAVKTEDIHLEYRHLAREYNDFEKEVLLPYKQSTLGPSLSKGDANGDGQEDLYLGGAAGQPGQLYIQSNGKFEHKNIPAFTKDSIFEDMGSLFFDLDQDGDEDLYVVSGGNEFADGSDLYNDRIYLNDGFGNYQRAPDAFAEAMNESGMVVEKIDYDEDGDDDLILGNRMVPHSYPMAAKSYILQNNNGQFTDVTDKIAPDFADFGLVNDVLVTDFNQDNRLDFIVVGEWTSIGFFVNNGNGFTNIAGEYGLDDKLGWWMSVIETDVNNDQQPDYVIGNIGLNTKFKASVETPFKIFGGDFDNNGSYDMMLSKKYKDEYVPVRGRECSSQQMPSIAQKFSTYDAFANATMNDILETGSSLSLEANEFRSLLMINDGSGGFTITYLPNPAQTFPLLSCVSLDINADGYEDLIMAGSIYNTEVETPRWDAGTGLVLLSNKKDGYLPLKVAQSGLFIKGNVKDIAILNVSTSGKDYLVAVKNNDLLELFEIVSIDNDF